MARIEFENSGLFQYDPSLYVTGVSFRTLDISRREELVQCAQSPTALAGELIRNGLVSEVAVLSTCNRFEVISAGGKGRELSSFLKIRLD